MSDLLRYGVWLVRRAEWGARWPRSVTGLTASKVTSHWEGPHMGPFGHESCAAKVRGIQAFHMDARGWTDIAYNAVACPHGYVFEGRGQGVRSAANGTTAGNSGAYAVCYLGGEGDGFTDAGERAMKAAGDWLTWAGSPRNGHRDWKSTACPGDEIYHWTLAGQPVDAAPAPVPDPPKKEEDDMSTYILGHPNGTGWLISPFGAVLLDGNTQGRYLDAGWKAVALADAATADAIIAAANGDDVQRARLIDLLDG